MSILGFDPKLQVKAEQIVEDAYKKRNKLPEDTVEILETWVFNVLLIWKKTHGVPPALDLRDQKLDYERFNEYAPEECAGRDVKNPIDLGFKLLKDEFPDFEECCHHLGMRHVFRQLILMTEPIQANLYSLLNASELIRDIEKFTDTHVSNHLLNDLEEMAPDAEYGKKMRNGPSRKKSDALDGEIRHGIGILKSAHDKEPTANQILEWLAATTWDSDVVQEISWDEKRIYWKRKSGIETSTSFKSFKNRVSKIRNPKD